MKNTELKQLEEQAIENEIRFSKKVVEIAMGFLEKTFTAEKSYEKNNSRSYYVQSGTIDVYV